MDNKKNLALKIIIPVLIICTIGIIWFIKNSTDEEPALKNTKAVDNSDFVLKVTEKLDIEKLKSYELPIVIDFGSDECIPCKRMAPVLEELNSELQEKQLLDLLMYGSILNLLRVINKCYPNTNLHYIRRETL